VDEAEAIHRAQQHDNEAWLALVTHHQTAVFRMAYLLLGNGDEAQDVAQETFLRAFRHLDRFDPARPLRPWLLQITKNLARNRRRSLRRYWAAWQRWWQADQLVATDSVHPMTAPIEAELLWRAVQRLARPDQEVIYLRYFLGMSVSETAATLGVAEGTIKSRHARALTRLRTVVMADFPELQPTPFAPTAAPEEEAV